MISSRSITFLLALFFVASGSVRAQNLPHELTEAEKQMDYNPPVSSGYTIPPVSEVRTPAEWEEIDGLCIRWRSSFAQSTLREIVRHAKQEATVYIVTSQSYVNTIMNQLLQNGITLDNIEFVYESSNSIWFRDYGQWNVYTDDVDSLLWVDWIYNRPRPDDDVVPEALADLLDIPLYQTTEVPYDLVNTGGNFMVDGFGTAFSSDLIMEENDGTGYGVTNHNEGAIDGILEDFMGIERYIKMPTLPYDGIHHIDMHMKLLDEETLLVGEYPQGVADGPQIETNLNYVLDNFNSIFGTDYKVVRIPMPPEGGYYPDTWGDYRTYTNSVFVNNTILVPTYEEQWDTTALRIYREALPGYKVVGIDCNEIITASGAIHCITKAVASDDPLWISHQALSDRTFESSDYVVDAMVKHAEGISIVTLHWTTDTAQGYNSETMTLTNPLEDLWTGFIPYQEAGETIFYYVHAEAVNGKQQNRPMPAPDGFWKFEILSDPTGITENELSLTVFPNPSQDDFVIKSKLSINANATVIDALGQIIMQKPVQTERIDIDLSDSQSGIYTVIVEWEGGRKALRLQKL
jgi:agmatine/peptidylarginine deiminase